MEGPIATVRESVDAPWSCAPEPSTDSPKRLELERAPGDSLEAVRAVLRRYCEMLRLFNLIPIGNRSLGMERYNVIVRDFAEYLGRLLETGGRAGEPVRTAARPLGR